MAQWQGVERKHAPYSGVHASPFQKKQKAIDNNAKVHQLYQEWQAAKVRDDRARMATIENDVVDTYYEWAKAEAQRFDERYVITFGQPSLYEDMVQAALAAVLDEFRLHEDAENRTKGIERSMHEALWATINNSAAAPGPAHEVRWSRAVGWYRKALADTLGGTPTMDELADYVNRQAQAAGYTPPTPEEVRSALSLFEIAAVASWEDDCVASGHDVEDPTAPDAFDAAEWRSFDVVQRLLADRPEQDVEIFRRTALDGAKAAELGREFGISAASVQRADWRTRSALKKGLADIVELDPDGHPIDLKGYQPRPRQTYPAPFPNEPLTLPKSTQDRLAAERIAPQQ